MMQLTAVAESVCSAETRNQGWLPFSQDHQIVYPAKIKVSLALSAREIQFIKTSWTQILDDSKTAQSRFAQNDFSYASFSSSLFCHQLYDNLLDENPTLIEMFPSIKHQAVSFAGIMNTAINNLENLTALDSVLEHLGRTHSRILGIEGPFFELMGDALIKTFQDRYLRSDMDFSIELEDCWIKLYCFLANSILQSGIDPVMRFETSSSSSVLRRTVRGDDSSHLDTESLQETLFEEKLTEGSSICSSRAPTTVPSHSKSSETKHSKDFSIQTFKGIANPYKLSYEIKTKRTAKLSKGFKRKNADTCNIM